MTFLHVVDCGEIPVEGDPTVTSRLVLTIPSDETAAILAAFSPTAATGLPFPEAAVPAPDTQSPARPGLGSAHPPTVQSEPDGSAGRAEPRGNGNGACTATVGGGPAHRPPSGTGRPPAHPHPTAPIRSQP